MQVALDSGGLQDGQKISQRSKRLLAGVLKRRKNISTSFWTGPADCAGSVGRILGGVSQDLILPDSQRSGTICLELGHGRIGKDLAVFLARRAPGKPGGDGSLRVPPGPL